MQVLGDVQDGEAVTFETRVEGLDKWINRLEKAGDMGALKGTMQTATEMLRDEIAPYPKASDANSPTQGRWYERGYGPRWRRIDGSVGGRRTSKTLGRRWTTKVTADGKEGQVGNNASYAPFVHHKPKQASFHKRRGWVSDEDAIKKAKPGILQLFKEAIERALG